MVSADIDKDQNIMFERGELKHYSHRVELWSENSHKSVVLLANNFEFSVENIAEIYKYIWATEVLYK